MAWEQGQAVCEFKKPPGGEAEWRIFVDRVIVMIIRNMRQDPEVVKTLVRVHQKVGMSVSLSVAEDDLVDVRDEYGNRLDFTAARIESVQLANQMFAAGS